MARFDVQIGTDELARHVDQISLNVMRVENSIDSMTESLVAAEEAAAENVSTNVTYGFYMLTRNQFLQKAIALENDVSMTLLKVKAYSEDLKEIKARMEKDYANISRQYLKIFRNIDTALGNSINELDEKLLEIAVECREKLSERRVEGSVKALSYPGDILQISEAMLSGITKKRAKETLEALKRCVLSIDRLAMKMKDSLSPEEIDGEETLYFPVVLIETESRDVPGSFMLEIKMPNFPGKMAKESGSIYSRVADLKADEEAWTKSSSTSRDLIHAEYTKLLSSLDSRKRALMEQLFDSSQWKEIKI